MLLRKSTDGVQEANVVVNPHGMIIVSEDLAAVFARIAAGDVELVNVPIVHHDLSPVRRRFFAVNALRLIDALCEQKTVRASRALGSHRPVVSLGIVGGKVPEDVHVFRVTGWPYPLLVDGTVWQRLLSLPHDGLGCLEVEQG